MKHFLIYSILFLFALNVTKLQAEEKLVIIDPSRDEWTQSGINNYGNCPSSTEYTYASGTVTSDNLSRSGCPEKGFFDYYTFIETAHKEVTVTPMGIDGLPNRCGYSTVTSYSTECRYGCSQTCTAPQILDSDTCTCVDAPDDDDGNCTPIPKPEGKSSITYFTTSQECNNALSNTTYTLNGLTYENLECWNENCVAEVSEYFLFGNLVNHNNCDPIPSDKKTVSVAQSNCNAEYFEFSQPVTGLEGRNYSPWYYGNFNYDTCWNVCVYEVINCPAGQSYGWDERRCVVPPDIGSDECTGEFYCINTSVGDGDNEICGKKCYCDGELVSDTPISCTYDTSGCQTCEELSQEALNNCPSPKILTFDCNEVNDCGTVNEESCTDPLQTCDELRSQSEPYCLPPRVFVWECEDTPTGANVTKDQCNDPESPDNNSTDPDDPESPDNNSTTNDPLLDATNETNKNLNDILDSSNKIHSSLEDISNKSDSLVSNTDSMKSSLSTISNDLKTSNNKLSSIDSKLSAIDSSIKSQTDVISDGLFSDEDPFADVELTDGSDKFGEFQNTVSSNFGILNNGDIFGLASIPASSLPTYQVVLYNRTITIFEPSMMNGLPLAEIRALLMFFAALLGFIVVFKTI